LATKPATAASIIALVTGVLREYSEKALFRGFVARRPTQGTARFSMVWHHERAFDLVLDPRAKTLEFAGLLPGVDAGMYRDLQTFLAARQSAEFPPHRRVDPAKARLRSVRRRGVVSLTMVVKDGDYEYATRKLIHVVHEIFLGFLVDGAYYEYMVEHLGLDPDRY
jgi:hypothetical protein